MKGIICAGGNATRLGELSRITNKHLLPVGPWPMIYYPLQMLQNIGVDEVMIVTGQSHAGDFINLLGDGTLLARFGKDRLFDLELTYRVQTAAGGIAQAVALAHNFIQPGEKFVVALGDNVIEGNLTAAAAEFAKAPAGHAMTIFKEVPAEDTIRFGIAKFDEGGKIQEIIEKPGKENPGPAPSNMAQTGLYFYDSEVFDVIAGNRPSKRGELEITDVNNVYIQRGKMLHATLEGWWRDVGSVDALNSTGQLIAKTGANKL